ncbi:hypothetical protein SDC9_47804 [bioreactor metagenome]|uniref:TIGR02453 family protein n=1 Tax=bioreactor metagenome TaxID=1076179 RepID=A0A644WH00_9ZZZZ
MFQGFTDKTLNFMWNIRFNNEKSWFEAHKDEYKIVLKKPMHELGREIYTTIAENHKELDLQLHISRIYRDARRLHGKGPYKDHLWFSLRQASEEWTDKPVFWFELTPESWSYGLGYYSAKALTMEKLRARIDNNLKPLTQLASELAGQKEFILEGDEYVKPKRDPGAPLSDWYNKKNFSLIHEEDVSQTVFSPDLAERIKHGFEFLIPFYRYFISLEGDPRPRGDR